MSEREEARRETILVKCEDGMGFRVDAKTLEPHAVSTYLPFGWDGENGTETMHVTEWNLLRNEQRRARYEAARTREGE